MESLVVERKYVAVGEKNAICTNLCTGNDCTNRSGEFQSDVHSNELISNENEDILFSDDEYHNAMDDDEVHISDNSQDDDLLELMGLLSDQEDN